MENKQFYEFEIEVTEKENHETKEKFFCYRAFTKMNVWETLKFTVDVPEEEKPTKSGLLKVKVGKINRNTKGRFPVIWVSEIFEYKEYSAKEQDLSKYFD